MIDFHCHVDLYPDPPAIVAQAKAERLYVLSVTTTPRAWRGTNALAIGATRIRTALGLHPQIAHQRVHELDLFESLLPEARYVGEIGLDGRASLRPYWREQLTVFENILRFTKNAGGRVMSIHSRRAADEVLDLLDQYPDAGIPVLHWFSGSKRQLHRAISMGAWFSVGPAMVRGSRGRAIVALMPPDRVLPETDGPFAKSGGRPLEPVDAKDVVESLTSVWNLDRSELEHLLLKSLTRLGTSSNFADSEFGRSIPS